MQLVPSSAPRSRVLRRSPQCIARPTNEEVRRLLPVGAAYASGGSAQGYTAPRWVPADIPNRIAHWSMVDSTVSTTAGEVTQVNDLVASFHLTGPYNGLDIPDDVATDSDLGNRRSCQHDYTVSIEDLGVNGLGDTGASTVALVFTLDSVTAGDSVFYLTNSGATVEIAVYIDTGPVWKVSNGTNTYSGGTPAANTPYLLVFENNGTSSLLKINGSTVVGSMSSLATCALNEIYLGLEVLVSSQGSKLTWTECLITSDVMSSADQASLLAWAQANCGV